MSKHIATDQLSFLATVLKMPINLPQKCVVRLMVIPERFTETISV
jgi:hypothetical protein